MAQVVMTIKIKFAWWLFPALEVYRFYCWVCDAEPDFDLIMGAVQRALLIKRGGRWIRC
jgi:hypothetical protein